MADVARAVGEGETPVNPYSLLEAVNNSSDSAHTAWLIFLGIMAYLMIAVAGVTHKDMLLETPVTLPIMQVSIQQALFFDFAPIILVLFHFGVISQLVLLAKKTLEFDYAVRALELTDRRTHPLRLELHNFFFVQAIAGPHRSAVVSTFLHAMAWLTLVALPIVILLFFQITYLPYHDVSTTWLHRICVLADIALLILIGIFLVRSESSFFAAFWRTSVSNPFSFLATVVLMIAVIFFSMLVATIPDEPLDQAAGSLIRTGPPLEAGRERRAATGYAVPFVRSRADGAFLGRFYRHLVVSDADLVHDKDAAQDEVSISLRGRDLRFAVLDRTDLHRADLTGANLEGASFVGADLADARIQCADVTRLILSEDRAKAQCVDARGANFSRANLSRARMAGIDLRGARLEEANLEGAELPHAIATGANFSSAKLDKADLTGGVQLQGANMLIASLQGAELAGAQMQGADLSSASVQGAVLSIANLAGATLRDADLEGADLQYAVLWRADMSGAKIRAADLRGAQVWMTSPPSRDALALADLTGILIKPPDVSEGTAVRASIERIDNARVKALVGEAVGPVADPAEARKWTGSPEAQAWASHAGITASAAQESYAKDLSEHLVTLACKPRYANGGIATGIAKRAAGTTFRGTPALISERLRARDCAAAEHVSRRTLERLAGAIDAAPAK